MNLEVHPGSEEIGVSGRIGVDPGRAVEKSADARRGVMYLEALARAAAACGPRHEPDLARRKWGEV